MSALYLDETGRSISTNSMLKSFRRCPRQAMYTYKDRLKPNETSKPLRRGTWIHSLLEAYYKGEDWHAEHTRMSYDFSKLFDEEKEALGDLPKECLGLMESYLWHYKADPWKVHEVEFTMDWEMPDGKVLRGKVDMLIEDRYGLWICDHKGLRIDEQVMTPDGWVTNGSLKLGDFVIGSDGKPTRVTGVYDLGTKPMYTVHLSDGTSVDTTDDHLWQVSRADVGNKILTTMDILNGKSPRYRTLPIVGPIQWPERELPIHPYVMGVLMGDGALSQGRAVVCNSEPKILEYLTTLTTTISYNRTPGKGERYALPELHKIIVELGLDVKSPEKFIPEVYLYASEEQRRALLSGLLDTDGSIDAATERIRYVTTSTHLKDAVEHLVRSLGGRAQSSKSPSYIGNVRYTDSWCVHIVMSENPFMLARKNARFKNPSRLRARTIVKVVPTEPAEARCIRVDAEDHLYVTKNCIVTHNTHKNLPDFSNRVQDPQSAIYMYLAQKNNIPVQGFIWNYIRTKGLTVPKMLKDGSRLSASAVDTDYLTYARAIKKYQEEHDLKLTPEIRQKLAYLKAQRFVPDTIQTSTFFRRETIEKDDAMLKRAIAENWHTMKRMDKYNFEQRDAVERTYDSGSCKFMCSHHRLCMVELTGGNADVVIQQNYKVADPMAYYVEDIKDRTETGF